MEKVKFLFVDDRKENLLALESLLKNENIDIFKAESGTEALELMLDHDFGLAILDVQMPEMDGFELAELMRGAQKTKSIPIIFVTAGARDQKNTFKGYETGAVDFLYKPLDPPVVKSKVTVFFELERQKKLLTEQLKQTEVAYRQLKQTESELEKALAMRDEFLSIASHELRTPITSLKMQMQMLERTVKKQGLQAVTEDSFDKMVVVSNRQIVHLEGLVDNLLNVSKAVNAKLMMHIEKMDLSEAVREVVDLFREQLMIAKCPIEIDAKEAVFGNWDRQGVHQIITNLITNASKYGAGKPIRIEVKKVGERARLMVQDQGIGISTEDQARIFKRFERAVAGQSISGLGLGLYIIQQLLSALGGEVRVESELGKGSRFTVELPLKTYES